ncbi:hydrolase [Pilimelia terevasa]|uniref:Hydrolase n=1 Tax=Pilimelia terevasa TaxID=53372 RepID=A0A8J3FHJ5_9ACTN|nr:Ppx/GppA phosphatase family protein [Pilimelia terevasa]GGK14684.1 hydrolase [Pilimelia terevasa]
MTRVAAVDCGTNSIRLLVADLHSGGARPLVREMEIVRLGQGVDRTGMLAPAALERTRAALARYAALIREYDCARVRMCATSATRDAGNAADFRDMVTATLGVPPEVISGTEEARLSFAGAVAGLVAPGPHLVIDIGGGSTEFVLGGPDGVTHARSVDIGCVRMTERHLHGDPPTAAQVAAAEADIAAAVDEALAAVPARTAATFVGLAGSVTTVAALALGLPAYDPDRIHHAVLTADDVARVTADLLGSTVAARRARPVMHPGRADVIAAGALVLRTVLERTGHPAVTVSEHDILDGIAASLR